MVDYTGITILKDDWVKWYKESGEVIIGIVIKDPDDNGLVVVNHGIRDRIRHASHIEVFKPNNNEKEVFFEKRRKCNEKQNTFKTIKKFEVKRAK